MTSGDLLLALALFQVKHYLADFQWQTLWMVQTKGRYGHPGGLAHSGIHGLCSLPVLLLMAAWAPLMVMAIVIAEMVLHYHIDWAKSQIVTWRGIDENDSAYWHYFGLDQAAHQVTYLLMLAALISLG